MKVLNTFQADPSTTENLRKKSENFGHPKIYCNHTKSLTRWLFLGVMHPKDAKGTANSVDPDQTAPLGAV